MKNKYCKFCDKEHPVTKQYWAINKGYPTYCRIKQTCVDAGHQYGYKESATVYYESNKQRKICIHCGKTKPINEFPYNSYHCKECCYIDTPNFKCTRCNLVKPISERSKDKHNCEDCRKEKRVENMGDDRLNLYRKGKMRCKICHTVYDNFIYGTGSYYCDRCKDQKLAILIKDNFRGGAKKYDVVIKLNNNLFPQIIIPKGLDIGISDITIPKVFNHKFEQPHYEIVLIEPFELGWKGKLLAADKFPLYKDAANWFACRDVFLERKQEAGKFKKYERLHKVQAEWSIIEQQINVS